MDGYTFFFAFIAAFFFFIFSFNLFSKFMTDKGTLISSGIVAGIAFIYMLIVPEDLQYIGLGVVAFLGFVSGLAQWFKK